MNRMIANDLGLIVVGAILIVFMWWGIFTEDWVHAGFSALGLVCLGTSMEGMK